MSMSRLRPFEDLGTSVRDLWARRKCAWLRPPLAALVAECGYLGMRGSGHHVRPRSTSAVRLGSVDGWRLAVMVLDGSAVSEAHMPKPGEFLMS